MIEKLFEFISSFYDYVKPYWIVEQYNKGILLRLGKFRKILEPGFYLKCPFLDYAIEHTVVMTTMRLYSQSLMTSDEKNIVVQAVVKYEISDIKTFLLEVNDAVDAISDMTQAIIKNILMARSWIECKSGDIDNEITKKARSEAKKWGINIMQVTLTDVGTIKTVRLINEGGRFI